MKLSHSSVTDVGLVRENNEDSLFVNEELNLFIVADGMGGHAGGEVASKLAVNTINAYFEKNKDEPDESSKQSENPVEINKLNKSIKLANGVVRKAVSQKPSLKGMGATVVLLYGYNDKIFIAHAGDSRIYLQRDGTMEQLTTDHSFFNEELAKGLKSAEELEKHPYKDHLVRAIGHLDKAVPDTRIVEPVEGDVYLLCSDGLTNMVDDGEISKIVKRHSNNLKKACTILVEKAKFNGGKDNITIILVRVD